MKLSVSEPLKNKHPVSPKLSKLAVLPQERDLSDAAFHFIFFDSFTPDCIRRCVLNIFGAARPSSANASALTSNFSKSETEGVLLVDVSNVFNEFNKQFALFNMYVECPAMSMFLIYLYRKPEYLLLDGEELLSQKGTTQGGAEGMV